MHRQHRLGIFGCHTKNTADPHPENASGSPQGNGPGHPHQITGTYRGSQSCAETAEGASVPSPEHIGKPPQCLRKQTDLYKAGPDRQIQSHTQNSHQGGQAPNQGVDFFQNCFHFSSIYKIIAAQQNYRLTE